MKQQKGFSIIEVLVVIVVLGLLGAAGWFVFNRMQSKDAATTSTSQQSSGDTDARAAAYVPWEFNGETWSARGDAPACPEPYTVASPMDAKKASAVLYPGQVRGGDFKPHGGLGTDGVNNIQVSAVTDAYLVRGSRYIEAGTVQYMFDFIDPCGFMYRLDHLAELSDEFKKYADQLPPAKQDDSRTTKYENNPLIKKGTVIATQVGYTANKNSFFDFGLYDLRKPNEASKTDIYQTDNLRIQDKEMSFFAVCWLDYIAGEDQAILKALPARGIEGKTNDYCK